MSRWFAISMCAALLCVIPRAPTVRAAPAAVIMIRLIDNGTGRGVRGMRVWLYLGDPWPHGARYLEERTGDHGTAVFHLHSPLPDQLFVYDEIDRIRSCSHGLLPTNLVIHSGVVADNVCDSKRKWKGKFQAKPGEIIVFARRLKWWYLQN